MRNFFLKPTDSLRIAMQRVNANGEGFGAVVDEDKKLLGTFCDTDGRHAMVRGVSLEAPVTDVMAKKSTRMERLPGGFVVTKGVVTDVVRVERPRIDGVVMAGGKGTRLRSMTGGVPKPLLSLGSSTIVERILTQMENAGVTDTWISLNYKAAQFRRQLRDRVHYLEEATPLGNAGALSMLPARGANQIFITNADLITGLQYQRMFDFHRSHDAPITMAAANFTTHLKYGVVHTRDGVLDHMDEKPHLEFLCNAGMYVIDRDVLRLVPKKKFFQMPDLIDAVQRRGKDVAVFPLFEKWVDAGSPEEFQQVLIEFATGREK